MATSLLEALTDEFRGVKDLAALTGPHTPHWVGGLAVPPHWHHLTVTDAQVLLSPARVLGWQPRPDHEWEATDTVEVYSYTGIPVFDDVYHSTASTLDDLDARDLRTQLLAMPARTGVLAERSTALVAVEGRPIWTQLTHYVAGSEQPHAGRLIVHTLYAAEHYHRELTSDIAILTASVYDTVTNMLTARGQLDC